MNELAEATLHLDRHAWIGMSMKIPREAIGHAWAAHDQEGAQVEGSDTAFLHARPI